MKIAFLGTKGIPNNYGGYEQFAEFISTKLVERGHQVTVYNPSFHNYKQNIFKGVAIRTAYSPEKLIGGAANIIYDHLCLRDALKQNFDIIYEAGYHSVALSLKYFNVKKRSKPIVVTNMDGLEWKRTKWSRPVQLIIKKLEQVAVASSPHLISDNTGIQAYLKEIYKRDSFYLPYGADPIDHFDDSLLKEYGVSPKEYFMLVARLEPENNIETILRGLKKATTKIPLLVVGNHKTPYGEYLKSAYESQEARFIGGIYSKSKLDALRFNSKAYFHGHSVGGTNPSLLEAMASKAFIWAHDNPFNRAILGTDAFYFDDDDDVADLVAKSAQLVEFYAGHFIASNFDKIIDTYSWDKIVIAHERLFGLLVNNSKLEE